MPNQIIQRFQGDETRPPPYFLQNYRHCHRHALSATAAYAAQGWIDALRDSPKLSLQANSLIESGHGPATLGEQRAAWLLAVQDPGFYRHSGIDLWTPGAGLTTVTQSLAKRIAFDDFTPGINKIRQTGYAFGLEMKLTKEQILTLFLHTVVIGRWEDEWLVGLEAASQRVYGRPSRAIPDKEFLSLVAVLIAPGKLSLNQADKETGQRVRRIKRLINKQCAPAGLTDVWLNACEGN